MKFPVTKPKLTEKRSDERNVFELVNQLRDLAGLRAQVRVRGNTPGDGSYVTIWSDVFPEGSYHLDVTVIGRGTSGGAWYSEQAGIQNFGGVLSAIGGMAFTDFREDAAAMDERLILDGETVALQVRDDGVQAMSWTAFISVLVAG